MYRISLNKDLLWRIVFLAVTIAVAMFLEYGIILPMRPQSQHLWRQADCASFALRYYHDGMHFFHPRVHNYLTSNGYCVGEFPIIYYFVAILYKLFGVHDNLFRLTNVVILFFGLTALYNLTRRITKDYYYSFVIGLLFFSSPLILFFGNNFLSDVSALSFVWMGWSRLQKYFESENKRQLILSFLFFTLAALLKLNSVISLVAISALFFIEIMGWATFKKDKKIFPDRWTSVVGLALSFGLILSYYLWAIWYNKEHDVSFLGTQSWPGWPIWEASKEDFLETVVTFFSHLTNIYYLPTVVVICFLTFYIFANRKALDLFQRGYFLLIFCGTIIFYLIFFVGFTGNIYYFINLMVLPVFIMIYSVVILQKKLPQVASSVVFKIILALFLCGNIAYAKSRIEVYYHNGPMHYRVTWAMYEKSFRNFVDSIGVQKDDKVISLVEDNTPNVGLYLIDRCGWSLFNSNGNVPDLAALKNWIGLGAKYLFVKNLGVLGDSALRLAAGPFVASFKDIYVYRLDTVNLLNQTIPKFRLTQNGRTVLVINESGQAEMAVQETPGPEEFIEMIRVSPTQYALRASNGKFFSANMNQHGIMTADKNYVINWERFYVDRVSDDKIMIRNVDGQYIKPAADGFLCSDSLASGNDSLFEISMEPPGK